jgi:predicted RNA-binding protein with PIN domain
MPKPTRKPKAARAAHWAVDGYNVMFAGKIEEGLELEKRRGDLLHRLRRLRGMVTVFFDAAKAPPGLASDAEGRGKLEIVYVKEGPADDAIVEWLRRRPDAHDIHVVTNDRELAGRVRSLRARTASVEEFLGALDPERLEGAEKPEISGAEAREWAKQFGVDPDAKF